MREKKLTTDTTKINSHPVSILIAVSLCGVRLAVFHESYRDYVNGE